MCYKCRLMSIKIKKENLYLLQKTVKPNIYEEIYYL